MKPIEPNNDPRCAHRDATTPNGLPYTAIEHVDDCSCVGGLVGAPMVVQLTEPGVSRCAVQQQPDGRHALFHAPECDGNQCGFELIELPAEHDPRAYDHLRDAGTLHIPAHLLMNDPAAEAEAARIAAPYEAMLADTGRPHWAAVVLGAGRLYADLTGRALPAPGTDDTFEDVARERLGRLGAAIAIELANHTIATDDERPLEAAATEIGEFGDIPEAAINALAPPVADLLAAALGVIETARANDRAEAAAAQ